MSLQEEMLSKSIKTYKQNLPSILSNNDHTAVPSNSIHDVTKGGEKSVDNLRSNEDQPDILSLIMLNYDDQIFIEHYSDDVRENDSSAYVQRYTTIDDSSSALHATSTIIHPNKQTALGSNIENKLLIGQDSQQLIVLKDRSIPLQTPTPKYVTCRPPPKTLTPISEDLKRGQVEHTSNVLTFDHNIQRVGNTLSINVHSCDVAWIRLLKKFEYVEKEGCIRGYVDGEQELKVLWETFQVSTLSSFTIRSTEKFYQISHDVNDKQAIDGKKLSGKAQWKRKPLVPFDGVPFVLVNKKHSGCRLGGSERTNSLNIGARRKRIKVGCPADAEILEVWRVPELSLDIRSFKSSRHKLKVKKELLAKVHSYILKKKFKKRFYIAFPLISKHENHPLLNNEAGRLRLLHPGVIETIYENVNQGITDRKVIRCMLEEFIYEFEKNYNIKIKFFDRSFYPTDRDLGSHIRNALNLIKSKTETCVLQHNVNNAESEKLTLNINGEFHEIDIATALNVDVNNFDVNTSFAGFTEFEEVITQANFKELDVINDVINDDKLNNYETVSSLLEGQQFSSQSRSTLQNVDLTACLDQSNCFDSPFNQSHSFNNFDQSQSSSTVFSRADSSLTNSVRTGDLMRLSKDTAFSHTETLLNDETNTQTLLNNTASTQNLLNNATENNELFSYLPDTVNQLETIDFSVFERQSNDYKRVNSQSVVNDCSDVKTLLKQEIKKSLVVIRNRLKSENEEKTLRGVLKRFKDIERELIGDQPIKKEKLSGIQSLIS